MIAIAARGRRFCAAALGSVLLVGSGAVLAHGAQPLKPGDDPPDVFGKSANGERVQLADYRGKIVVVSFWASWCGPCRKEMPVMLALQKKATRDQLIVVSVNWRQNSEAFRQIKKMMKDFGVTLVSDEYGHAGDAYGVKAIPHMIIIGRDGKIAAIHTGYSEDMIPTLVDEINALWVKAPPENP